MLSGKLVIKFRDLLPAAQQPDKFPRIGEKLKITVFLFCIIFFSFCVFIFSVHEVF